MDRRQWERLARRVKREAPYLYVDTQDWYVRREGRRLTGYGLQVVNPRTGQWAVLWRPDDWIVFKGELV